MMLNGPALPQPNFGGPAADHRWAASGNDAPAGGAIRGRYSVPFADAGRAALNRGGRQGVPAPRSRSRPRCCARRPRCSASVGTNPRSPGTPAPSAEVERPSSSWHPDEVIAHIERFAPIGMARCTCRCSTSTTSSTWRWSPRRSVMPAVASSCLSSQARRPEASCPVGAAMTAECTDLATPPVAWSTTDRRRPHRRLPRRRRLATAFWSTTAGRRWDGSSLAVPAAPTGSHEKLPVRMLNDRILVKGRCRGTGSTGESSSRPPPRWASTWRGPGSGRPAPTLGRRVTDGDHVLFNPEGVLHEVEVRATRSSSREAGHPRRWPPSASKPATPGSTQDRRSRPSTADHAITLDDGARRFRFRFPPAAAPYDWPIMPHPAPSSDTPPAVTPSRYVTPIWSSSATTPTAWSRHCRTAETRAVLMMAAG